MEKRGQSWNLGQVTAGEGACVGLEDIGRTVEASSSLGQKVQ